jgi:8-oxo-dGTP pyrophosphatase MutT (NUDIX family)
VHHRPLHALLDRYAAMHTGDPDEAERVRRARALVESGDGCLCRTHLPGHFTASAWIVSPDRRRFLLTHHRKLDRWLQLGGHADGDGDLARVALREAREESGMCEFECVAPGGARGAVPVDLDVHGIPAREDEPAHDHYDVRFVLVARAGQALRRSAESRALGWFDRDDLDGLPGDESLRRLGRKAFAWLDGGEGR